MVTIQLMSACFFVLTMVGIRYLDNTLVLLLDIALWTLLNVWFNRVILSFGQKNKRT